MQKYRESLNMVLMDFQFIEESLKMYISTADEIIEKKVSNVFPYKYKRKDVEKFALGQLLKRYEKISDNTTLIKQLKKHMKTRNTLAHRGFLFTVEEQKDKALLEKLSNQLDKLHDETKVIVLTLLAEGAELQKHLKELTQTAHPIG